MNKFKIYALGIVDICFRKIIIFVMNSEIPIRLNSSVRRYVIYPLAGS